MSSGLKPVIVKRVRGVNTRLRDTELVTEEGDWLRSGVNVDLSIEGKATRRPGYVQRVSGTAAHSIFGDGRAPYCYVDGTNLYRLRTGGTGLLADSMRSDLTAGPRLSYARVDDVLYYSNSVQYGMLTSQSHRSDWGTLPPGMDDPDSPVYKCRPMPPGRIVRDYKGRLLVARGSNLFISNPFVRQIYHPVRGYIPWLADVTVVAPLDTGVFLATTEKTFWLAGDLTEVVEVLPYGAALYSDSLVRVGTQRAWVWMSPRGIVRGTSDGVATALQEKYLTPGFGPQGATFMRESDGLQKVIGSVSPASPNAMGARSYFEAEIVRKGDPQ